MAEPKRSSTGTIMRGEGPLVGGSIVEMEAIGPVPLVAMILADMGADVVRLVRPRAQATGGSALNHSRATVEARTGVGDAEVLGAAEAVGRWN
ncbi:hypothetical protein ACFSCW_08140 [Sphingomonas tabacisoli]|uniref:CoA transferase n=1 Tax=Sphingomonas tabacisoli TaxID=2249466 RepID=A0ABW4I1K1_9SPHN